MGSNYEGIRSDSPVGFQLPVRSLDWSGATKSRRWLTLQVDTALVSSSSYETHRVASEVTLAHAQESGKGHSVAPLSPSTPSLVVKQEQCASRPIIASPSTWSSKVYSRLKLRLGCTLKRTPLQEVFGHLQKVASTSVKNSLSGPKEFQVSLQGPDCTDSNGQHNCRLLHQQGEQ